MCTWTYDLYTCGHKSHYKRTKPCSRSNSCSAASGLPNYLDVKCDTCKALASSKSKRDQYHNTTVPSTLPPSPPSSCSSPSPPPSHAQSRSGFSKKRHSGVRCNNSLFQDDPFNYSSQQKSADYIPRSLYPISASSHRSMMATAASMPPQTFVKSSSSSSFPITSASPPMSGRQSPSTVGSQKANYLYGDQNFVWHQSNSQ